MGRFNFWNGELIGLSLEQLQAKSVARSKIFKNKSGAVIDTSNWTPAEWLEALVGELGEYANFRKKFRRGDLSEQDFHIEACKELADVQIYLALLADSVGVDLGRATVAKFNEVSERIGCYIKLYPESVGESQQEHSEIMREITGHG